MNRQTTIRAAVFLAICAGQLASALSAAPPQKSAPRFDTPVACFFFDPDGAGLHELPGPKDPKEEWDYAAASANVYRLWCTSKGSTHQQKIEAADAMAAAWRKLWDRDDPYNASFHETGALDLLVLLGLTGELPSPMRADPKFTAEWASDCAGTCFEFYVAPETPSGRRYIVNLFRLVNDLRHKLKKEPASEPVLAMLEEAKFTLVD